MTKPVAGEKKGNTAKLGLSEQRQIDRRINFESSTFIHSLVKFGVLANIVAGFLYAYIVYSPEKAGLLGFWYGALIFTNLLNALWAYHFEKENITHREILRCRRGILLMVAIVCLIWGSTGVLFMGNGNDLKLVTVIFLMSAVICFAFSASIDLTLGILSIVCLLVPAIVYHVYLAYYFSPDMNAIGFFSISISAAFTVLGLFMIAASYVANKTILKVFRLGYENDLLRQKFEALNETLEHRIQERTEKLETSLALVTFQATHDLLTDLPNERLLYDQIFNATEEAVKYHQKFAIACFSLNNMQRINDSIGHEAASTIIHRVAQRFMDAYEQRENYFVSLARGDVFVIVIESIRDAEALEADLQEMFALLDKPVYVANQNVKLTGSIGVSVYPDHGRNGDRLFTNAEAARLLAARSGGNTIRMYDTVINADASKQLNIENLLYYVIENNELILNYQPFIDLKTNTVCGAEALIRWESPALGLVSPMDFIPVAEANGMIIPIGEWVLRTACQQLKDCHERGFSAFRMSINLSAKQLAQPSLVDRFSKIIREMEVDPNCLDFELTESNAFQREVIPIINRFTQMGISLSIDDFGTGHSEFSSLKFFKVDKIKIDKSFIEDLDVNVDSRNIVSNTIALAERMHINCIAEGVETEDQVKFLTQNGCFLMQGYYYSRPLNAENFLEFIKNFPDTEEVSKR